MIRFFLTIILFKSILFGCSLCSVYTPRTHVSTHIKTDNQNIKTLSINWSFAKQFSDELLQIYDLNLDGTFDKKELKFIEDALLNYLEPRNFLTTISYDNKIDGQSIPFEVQDYKMSFKNGILNFDYNITLNYKLYDKNILNIRVFDKEGYFFIIFQDEKQKFDTSYEVKKSTNISEVTYTINAPTLTIQEIQNEVITSKIEKVEEKEKIYEEPKKENFLDIFTNNIKKYLVDIENGDKIALVFLLMASFIYGVVHALGPGHGKALAFSYFSSQKSSYFEAFIISLFTAFVHIIGALIIVLISVLILQSVLNNFIENSVTYITALSAVIIMFLALYILYKKVKKKSCSCVSCSVELKSTKFDIKPKNQNFVKLAQNKPILLQKRSKKQDLIFVLTAGIVPCPGTVLLFVYAFLLKTYFAVFLASISISLGMAVVIFASSFLGVSIHKMSSKSSKIINILEILAPIFMFILALLLLLSSKIF
ncbi:DUF1007 family protein [Aliarcobacter butzleri]|uniref:HoxN/HupN/NixA family nickel/cobalt transporter n=1 Tax=Aliarcobacter butzleri TaxID=28197 RepID=UPI0021B203B3|nr:DUF1007 family protein [Aliarcobacter butzleri]MCT7603872.1 DUF1007 family protein [Aliarcobacter butzleri]MCT7648980.1 DUF1007 family protein [Aliarcobacter butzleri]